MHLFPRVTITNYHKQRKTRGIYTLTYMEAGSPKACSLQCHGPLMAPGKNPSFWWLPVILGAPWHVPICIPPILPLSFHDLLLSVFYLLSSVIKIPLIRYHPMIPAVITLTFISETVFLSCCWWLLKDKVALEGTIILQHSRLNSVP